MFKRVQILLVSTLIYSGCSLKDADSNKIRGFVVDGELKNATVFLDLNHNYKQDNNEPFAKTDSNGKFEIVLNSDTLNSKSYKEHKAVIVAVDGVDIRTDKKFTEMLSALPEDYKKEIAVNSITTLATEWILDELDKIEKNNRVTKNGSKNKITIDYTKLIKDKLNEIYSKLSNILEIKKESIFKNPYKLIKENREEGIKTLKIEMQLQQTAILTKKRAANSLTPKSLYDKLISQKCKGGFLCIFAQG